MLRYIQCLLLGALCFLNLPASLANTPLQSPPNVTGYQQTINALIYYHDSGQYDRDLTTVYTQATTYLAKHLHDSKKRPAIVFDIDETTLSDWPMMIKTQFHNEPATMDKWINEASATTIKPALALYRYAQEQHVAVFFITGRAEHLRAATIKNLHKGGYHNWAGLYLRPDGDRQQESVTEYKSHIRQAITQRGYHIVLNVGDQYSDLCGGNAQQTVKLPNPFYYLPGCSVKQVCQWAPAEPRYQQRWAAMCRHIYS
tara:strand:+ start:12928 stop:13698 length:771 start_codon:yes stop_codon:yes gene_type:complete